MGIIVGNPSNAAAGGGLTSTWTSRGQNTAVLPGATNVTDAAPVATPVLPGASYQMSTPAVPWLPGMKDPRHAWEVAGADPRPRSPFAATPKPPDPPGPDGQFMTGDWARSPINADYWNSYYTSILPWHVNPAVQAAYAEAAAKATPVLPPMPNARPAYDGVVSNQEMTGGAVNSPGRIVRAGDGQDYEQQQDGSWKPLGAPPATFKGSSTGTVFKIGQDYAGKNGFIYRANPAGKFDKVGGSGGANNSVNDMTAAQKNAMKNTEDRTGAGGNSGSDMNAYNSTQSQRDSARWNTFY